MTDDLCAVADTGYLRMQSDRCRRLSRTCMDLGTARDLRLMADEHSAEAARLEAKRLKTVLPRT
jgi:hypothetical protein